MKKKRIVVGALLCALMMLPLTACNQNKDSDLSDFKTPVGYKWEGSYVEENGTTTMVIEKKSGKKYNCTVNITDEEITHMDTYEFTAVKDDYGLTYEDGVHTTYEIPDYEKDPEASVTTNEVYKNGTGSIYYLDGYVYWIDDVNNAGTDYAFKKTEEE